MTVACLVKGYRCSLLSRPFSELPRNTFKTFDSAAKLYHSRPYTY